MNIFRNIKKLDKEKLFYRSYVGVAACFYGFVMTGLYIGNSLYEDEIDSQKKFSHSQIQKKV